MARGEIDEFARLERRHDDERPGAMDHGVHKGDETGHMAHGNGDETNVVFAEPHRHAIVDDGMGDAEMREHRAFRTAGRAGRIENCRGLFLPDRLGLSNRRGAAELGEHRAAFAPDRDGVLQTGEGARRGNAVGEVEFMNDDLRRAILDDMAVLGQRMADVERNRHGAEPRYGEEHDDKLDAVAEHHGDAIAFLNPERP